MSPPDRERSYWSRTARHYDATLRILGRPYPRMLALIAQEVTGAGEVLEVAAGTGLVTVDLARAAHHVVATDYAPGMVEKLRVRLTQEGLTNVTVEAADVVALGYETGRFDCVVAANVLHLLPSPDAALAEIRRVLRPDGLFIAPTFCHAETWRARTTSRILGLFGFPGQRRLTALSLRTLLEDNKFEVIREETIPGLLPIGFVSARAARGPG